MKYNMFYKGEYIGCIADNAVFLESEGIVFIECNQPPNHISVIVTGIEESLKWKIVDLDDTILEEGKGNLDFDYGRVYEYEGCTYVLEDHDTQWGFTRFDLFKMDKNDVRKMIPEVQNDL